MILFSLIQNIFIKVLNKQPDNFHIPRTYRASWYDQRFIHQLMHKLIVLKNLKFTIKLTLKHIRHVSVQSHHHQGAHYSCLLKLHLLK